MINFCLRRGISGVVSSFSQQRLYTSAHHGLKNCSNYVKNLGGNQTLYFKKGLTNTSMAEHCVTKRNFYSSSHILQNNQSIQDETKKDVFTHNEFRLIYEGPLSKKIKLLKLFSLTTASMSILAGPALLFMGRTASLSMFAKLFLASTIVTMGVTTTVLLHWLTRVYVYRMYFQPQTRMFAAETSSLFGGVRRTEFSVEDVILPEIEAAFSTFEARGNKYFIHMDLKEAEQILNYVKEYNFETLS